MTISERIRLEREKRGMTQNQLAILLNTKQGHYSRIESGVQRITSDQMLILYDKLNIDIHYLVTGDYLKFNYNLDKMEVSELRKIMNEIISELENRIAHKLHK